MAAPAAAAAPDDSSAARPPPPSLLCLPPELLVTVAGHLWATGHGSAWSALSRTCTAIHRACDQAVRRVELPPVTPAGLHEQLQPLGGLWRRALDGQDKYCSLGYGVHGAPLARLDDHVLDASMIQDVEPSLSGRGPGHGDDAPTVHEAAVADELVQSVAAFLKRLSRAEQGGGGRGHGGGGVRVARFGRCEHTGREPFLPYSPANAEVLGRLLPHLARCPLGAFAADQWVIRLLGRGGARLSAAPLRTLRLRRATTGDGPTHWAIASVVRTHAAELVELTAGLHTMGGSMDHPGRHHPTGFLAYWLGAVGGPTSPPPPPPPYGPVPPCADPLPPVSLPCLRIFSFLGSVSSYDASALVAAAPRIAHLHLTGAVGVGGLAALALPALPELSHLVLHTFHQAAHLRAELPRVLTGRPPLAVLRLPETDGDVTSACGWVWTPDQLWCGAQVAAPVELVASDSLGLSTSAYDDATVVQVCGLAAGGPVTADETDGGARVSAGVSEMVAPTGVAMCRATGLRSLTINLGASATDAAVTTLAALPALATLRLSLDSAVGVRLASWPAFPALTGLSLALVDASARCGVTPVAALDALSAPPSTAPASLITLRFIVYGRPEDSPPPPPLSEGEAGGWPSPPPDLSPLASWTGLRSFQWESPSPKGGVRVGCSVYPSAAEEVCMAATARRVAATLPRVATVVKCSGHDDPWGPDTLYMGHPWFYHPDGGCYDGPVSAQAV